MGIVDYVRRKRREAKISSIAKRHEEAARLKEEHQSLQREAARARERSKMYRDIDKAQSDIKAERKARFDRSFLGKASKGLQGLDKSLSKPKVQGKRSKRKVQGKRSKRSRPDDIFGDGFLGSGGKSIFGNGDIGLFPGEYPERRKRKKRRK